MIYIAFVYFGNIYIFVSLEDQKIIIDLEEVDKNIIYVVIEEGDIFIS